MKKLVLKKAKEGISVKNGCPKGKCGTPPNCFPCTDTKKYLDDSKKKVKNIVEPLRKKEIQKGIITYDDYLKQQILKKNKKGGSVKSKKK
jgi:hypothetical protein